MPETFADPRIPAVERCVLRPLLERRARETPERTFARFADGTVWTYGQARAMAIRTANGLRALGVGQGDVVLAWLPNGPEVIRLWFGLNYLGAVFAPINLAYRGRLLEHVVDNAGASLIVAHADLYGRLADVKRAALASAVVVGGPAADVPGIAVHAAESLLPDDCDLPALERAIMPWDMQSIIYTSGTTGPSKGVMSSYLQLYSMGEPMQFGTADDRFMINLPMFHVGGTFPTYAMLVRGGSIVMVDAFDTARFWSDIRETGTTAVVLLGAMAGFLMKQPPRADDRDHPLRHAIIVPIGEEALALGERFGIAVWSHFNMTEISMPLVSARDPRPAGTCGRPRAGVEVRIVDAHDCEVPEGQTGELIVRADRPWAMNHGYYRNPEATAAAWRNGWFHTGDLFRADAAGNYFFVDRLKDAIRRRGENISSYEVEVEICAHAAVKEAAAVAVPSEFGEDEVLAVVALAEGASLAPAALIEFLLPRLPHFMIPRYLRFVADLPKTPTQKVQKYLLRSEGLTAEVWDREQAGIRIRREKIG